MNDPSCRFCGSPLRLTFADLGATPLSNSYLAGCDLENPEKYFPLHAYVCSECLLVQIEEFEPAKNIFGDYAYFSSFSDTWLQHCEEFADAVIGRFSLGPGSKVVEIASNDGYLLQFFKRRGVPVLGVEPARNVAETAVTRGVPTIVEFFGEKCARSMIKAGHRAGLVVANNVLAHVPDLNDFVKGLKLILASNGVVSAEFPHIMRLIENCQFDTIYHEHFSYFSFRTIERVFASQGLTIFDVEELPTHGGSLRVYARPAENEEPGKSDSTVKLLNKEEKAGLGILDTYTAFSGMVKESKRNLLKLLIDLKDSGATIAGYGAPAKGNTLLNYCGIGTDFIDFTVDRSQHKQGRWLPGSRIPVFAPDRIREARPDYVLILPWNLENEIRQQMAYIHEWGGKFIVPIPKPEILD